MGIADGCGPAVATQQLRPSSCDRNLAARVDVQSISPNRRMTRATSTLESVAGSAALRTTANTAITATTATTATGNPD